MCSKLWLNARDSGRFARLLHICRNYALQTLCGAPHKVCNEEGKLLDLPLNRSLRDEAGRVYDIIAGTFFLCAAPPDSEHFASLSEEQLARYQELFRNPELFWGGAD